MVINYLVQGFRGKNPRGWVFFSASLRSAKGRICKYAQPIEKKFNVLKQNKKYYLKSCCFIYVRQVI